jgi:ATP-dependent Lhr-like helicase
MLVGPKRYPFQELMTDDFFTPGGLEPHIEAALNLTEMSLRQFRNIAQNAGLVFTGYPSARKSGKQMQVSTSLLFEVFRKYDPQSLLFKQARTQVLEQQLDIGRLHRKLEDMREMKRVWVECPRPSPLAVPIWAEMNAARLSTETFQERMERMKREWMAAAP